MSTKTWGGGRGLGHGFKGQGSWDLGDQRGDKLDLSSHPTCHLRWWAVTLVEPAPPCYLPPPAKDLLASRSQREGMAETWT